MSETCVEFMEHEVVVYFPGTTEIATTRPSLEGALAFAREEWPDLGVRVILLKTFPQAIPVSAPSKKYCHRCGREIAPNVAFCDKCGAKQ